MKKASISHDEAMIRQLRESPFFAAEYLKAALEDSDEPKVLLIALRHVAEAQGWHRQSSQGRRGRTREFVSRPVCSRQPASFNAGRCHQGDWPKINTRSAAQIERRTCSAPLTAGHRQCVTYLALSLDDRAAPRRRLWPRSGRSSNGPCPIEPVPARLKRDFQLRADSDARTEPSRTTIPFA